ncbi:MAG TPA: hypothetical protein VHC90_04420 [Bryobacteraceae bacterium]|nr:hypothetical protein [Bryobacteraceae bacterium]
MTEFLKSFSSMSIAIALLPIRQVQTVMEGRDPCLKTMDAITSTTIENFRGALFETFCALDNAQRGAIAMGERILAFRENGAGPDVAVTNETWHWTPEDSCAEERRADFRLRL